MFADGNQTGTRSKDINLRTETLNNDLANVSELITVNNYV